MYDIVKCPEFIWRKYVGGEGEIFGSSVGLNCHDYCGSLCVANE